MLYTVKLKYKTLRILQFYVSSESFLNILLVFLEDLEFSPKSVL